MKFWFKSELVRLSAVKPDDVCLRIQAAFTDASVSVWGFDVASLRGELGELILAFDHRAQTMRPFAFLDVDFTTLASIALDIIDIFTEVPRDVNKLIEDHLSDYDTQQHVLKYLRAFLARAVGQSSTFHEFKLVGDAWRIRHSDDPVIPRPGAVRPDLDIGPGEGGGIIGLIARHSARLGLRPPPFESEIAVLPPTRPAVDAVTTDVPSAEGSASEPAAGTPPEPTPASTRTATAARLPAGFLTEGEQLTRLDRHQSIVVVMMENRSCHAVTGKVNYHPAQPTNILAFKKFDQPVAGYTSKSCDIDLSALADFTPIASVTGCGTTVTFSSTFEKRSVPNSWASWGSPPDTESATPNIAYSAGATSATVDFGKKVKTGGFEYEPDLFQVETVTVEFHRGANGTGPIVGTITRDVDGSSGARLFGAHRRHGFKSVVVSNSAGDDFAIAQIRV